MNGLVKTIAMTCVLLGSGMMPAQQMRTTIIYTTGQGSSTNADKGQATSDATQTATNWASSSCIGTVTDTNVTFSQCSPIGSGDDMVYACTVTVRAKCEIQSRSK